MTPFMRRSAPVVFFMVALAPLTLVAYYSITLSTDALTHEAAKGAAAMATTNGGYIDQRFSAFGDTVGEYAQQQVALELGNGNSSRYDLPALELDLGKLVNSRNGPDHAFVTDAAGRVLAIAPADSSASTTLNQEEWYLAVAAAQKTVVVGPSLVQGHREVDKIVVASPIIAARTAFESANVIGHLVAVYSLVWAQSMVEEFAQKKAVSVSLVDPHGTVVVTPKALRGTVMEQAGRDSALQGALGGRSAVRQRRGSHGEVFSAYAPLAIGWVVVVDTSAREAMNTVARLRTTVLVIDTVLACVLLTATLTGILLLRRAQQSAILKERNEDLQRLDEAARTVHGLRGRQALDKLRGSARELVDGDVADLWLTASGNLVTGDSDPKDGLSQIAQLISERFGPDRPARLTDVAQLSSAMEMFSLGPVVSVPLLAGAEVLGRLTVARTTGRQAFTNINEGLLRQLAQHAVTAIEKGRQDDAIEEKNEELEQANRLKSEFLANMSHELRTPLSAIIGFSELLLDGADGELNEDVTEDVGQIHRSGRALLRLINDILDLSKIEAGRMTLELNSHDLGPLIDDVLAGVRPLAEARGIGLVSDTPLGLDPVWCDQMRVGQVLTNLVSNAIKFTNQGDVTVRCQHLRDSVEVSVVDTGIGMPAEALAHIFEEFIQAESGTTRRFGGTGLGLAISRKLIELQEGVIGVESNLGEGSRFWFRLPRSTETRAAGAEGGGVELGAAAQSPTPWRGQTRDLILIVDDEATTRHLIQRRLLEAGFETAQAEGAMQALRMARELHPAVITLDVMMPGTDGWKVLAALKGDTATADIPVVMVSIVDGKEAAIELGAAAYLTKPFTKQELISRVRSVLPAVEGADILCVDDEASARELLRRNLASAGVRVRLAVSATEALAEIDRRVPDAIFADLTMPGMSGFDLVAELRTRPELDGVPIIVLTARDLSPDDVEALGGRIDRFISKSELRTSDLTATIRQAIEHKRKTRALGRLVLDN